MKLPRLIDPRKLAGQGTRLQGSVPADEMPRLSRAVLEVAAVQVDLTFSRDAEYRTVIEGNYRLDVSMTCQRCLQPVSEQIEGALQIGVVWDESKVADLPKSRDPWIVGEESGDLYELLEDEFLLSLPIVPFHEESACSSSGRYSTGDHEETRENPFSILAKLKQ